MAHSQPTKKPWLKCTMHGGYWNESGVCPSCLYHDRIEALVVKEQLKLGESANGR